MAPKLQDSGLRIVSGERLMKHVGLWLSASLCLAASTAMGADKVSFGTNWLAEAEHGGYYQAVVDGTYAKYGLDVTIVQGGPQANNGLLLAAGKLDFYMGGNLLLAFDTTISLPKSGGGTITVTPADLVAFHGTNYTLDFNGVAAGIPAGADLVGAMMLPNADLLLTMDEPGAIGAVDFFTPVDVLEFDPGSTSWVLSFNGMTSDTWPEGSPDEWGMGGADDLYSDIDADCDDDGNGHRHSDGNGNCYSDRDWHGDSYSDRHADCYTHYHRTEAGDQSGVARIRR